MISDGTLDSVVSFAGISCGTRDDVGSLKHGVELVDPSTTQGARSCSDTVLSGPSLCWAIIMLDMNVIGSN